MREEFDVRILVADIAGWAVWNNAGGHIAWAMLSGCAAVLAIVHSTLSVSSRLKLFADSQRSLSTLRIDLETFRYRMTVDPEFPVSEYTDEFIELRRRYAEAIQTLKSDFLRTKSLRIAVQQDLNVRLKDQIISKDNSHGHADSGRSPTAETASAAAATEAAPNQHEAKAQA